MARDVREGMTVRTADGERLGTVVHCGAEGFVAERGLLFPREYVASYEDVAEVSEREVRLSTRRGELRATRAGGAEEERAGGDTSEDEALPLGRFGDMQDFKLELAEEVAVPETHVASSGVVRIRKVVRTEVRTFRIPVRREEIHVERLPVDAGARGRATEPPLQFQPFQETSFVIPLYEEQVEFTKQPRVWQEVLVTRSTEEELARVRTRVRRETAQVEGESDDVIDLDLSRSGH